MAETSTLERSGTLTLGGDMTVRRLGFGAMRITGKGIWGPPRDHGEALRVLRRAVELGVNLIDTADAYGPHISEELIAEALHPYPDDLVIATKGGLLRHGPGQWTEHCDPDYLRQAVELSLRRLRLERIDLYQLHTVDRDVPIEESLGELKRMQDEGKIRHIGVSNVSVQELARARAVVDVVSVQNRFNAVDREHEAVLEACEADGLGFIPWYPLATGDLARHGGPLAEIAARLGAEPSQVALAWLLRRSPVMLPIPGTSRVAHLEDNIQAAALELSDDDVAAIDAAGR